MKPSSNYERIAALSRTIGTHGFMQQLHRFITANIRIDHVALEYVDRHFNLIPIDRASISSLPIKQLGKGYREAALYTSDPMRFIESDGQHLTNDMRLMIHQASDLGNSQQADLFRRFGICQRLIVGQRSGRGWICQKLIRCEHFGPVSAQEIDRLKALAPLITSLAFPHTAMLLQRLDPSSWFHSILLSSRVLELIFSGLSPRELESIHWVLAGLTNEEAAVRMGISINTFITLRARAYRKSQVSSLANIQQRIRDHIQIE